MANFIKVPIIWFDSNCNEQTRDVYINIGNIVSIFNNPFVPSLNCNRSDLVSFRMSNGDRYLILESWWQNYIEKGTLIKVG